MNEGKKGEKKKTQQNMILSVAPLYHMPERVKPYLTSESTPACFLIEVVLICNAVLVSDI